MHESRHGAIHQSLDSKTPVELYFADIQREAACCSNFANDVHALPALDILFNGSIVYVQDNHDYVVVLIVILTCYRLGPVYNSFSRCKLPESAQITNHLR